MKAKSAESLEARRGCMSPKCPECVAILSRLEAMGKVVEALKMWVDYFDRLERDDEPGDPIAIARKQFHGERIAAARAALRLAEQAGGGE